VWTTLINSPVYFQSFLNLEDSPGNTIQEFYTRNSIGGTLAKHVYNGWLNLDGGSPATWNGTAGSTDDVVFSSPHGLSVGDWIRHNDTNRAFYVSAINSTTEATISNALSQTIPSISSVTSVMQALTSSVVGGSSGVMIGCTSVSGGGGKIFASGENHPVIVGIAPAIGGEELSYEVYGSGTVKISGYWFNRLSGEYGEMTLAAPTGGSSSLNGNVVENVDADDGLTTYTVRWDANADGFAVGDSAIRFLRAFV
jgi:hypothetical protein